MRQNLTTDEQRQVTQQTSVHGLGPFLAELAQAGGVYRYVWDTAPVAKDIDVLLAATVLTAAAQEITAGLSDPDVPRNVRVEVQLAGATELVGKTVTVHGTDINGTVIEEDFDVEGADGLIVVGTKCFATITQVDLPIRGQAGDTISVGTGDKLGIDKLLFSSSLLRGVRGAAVPLNTADAGTLVADEADFAMNGYTPASAPDGTLLYRIFVLQERD